MSQSAAPPAATSPLAPELRPRLHLINLSLLVLTHVLGVLAVFYMALVQFSWWTVALGLVWSWFCGISITGGYHRLFAHKTYRASPLLQMFYLAFGAAAVQNSALCWARDHRDHHAYTDRDPDPYDSRRGFWWSHVGWVVFHRSGPNLAAAGDLDRSRLVQFQHRHYVLIAFVFVVVLPGLLGLLWGDPFGAILVAGFLRLTLQWHATFSINSFCHLVGSRPYSERSSARDSHCLAVMTFGEGYHNFHHRFPTDYRTGARWFQYDPTKWWVWCLARLRLTRDLRRVSPVQIARVREFVAEQRAARRA